MSVRRDSPLDMWSRRRAAVRAEEEALERERAAAEAAARQKVLEGKSDDELLRELDLPDPEQMGGGDDFSPFMRPEVPERLRRLALRRLWRADPVLANVDGLVDYGEDFSAVGMVREVVATAYAVGRGMIGADAPGDAPGDAPPGDSPPGGRSDETAPASAGPGPASTPGGAPADAVPAASAEAAGGEPAAGGVRVAQGAAVPRGDASHEAAGAVSTAAGAAGAAGADTSPPAARPRPRMRFAFAPAAPALRSEAPGRGGAQHETRHEMQSGSQHG